MAKTKIVLNNQSDLILTNAVITSPSGLTQTDIDGLVGNLSTRVSVEQSLDAKLTSDISTELSARVSGDLSLENKIDFITSNVDGAALDSLTEIVTAFQSADGDLNGAITTLAGAAGTDLSAEISARTSADLSLDEKVDSRHNDQHNYFAGEISTELSARISADLSLDEKVDSRHNDQHNYFAGEISTELSARISADLSLDEKLDSRHNDQHNYFAGEISTELSARISADLSLDEKLDSRHNDQHNYFAGEISTELSARISADLSLDEKLDSRHNDQHNYFAGEISTELSARVSGDASLQNQIDFITNNTDAAAIDSLTEIVAAFQSADGDINNAISNLSGAATSGLSAEISRAESVELVLSTELSNEVDSRVAGDANLQSSIDAMASTDNTTIEIDAVNNVIRLTENIAAPISGVRTFTGDVKASSQPDTLPSYDGLSFITKGILDVTVADLGTVSAELSTETARAEAAEAGIQAQLDAMPSTDNTTLEVDGNLGVIKLKDIVDAPTSGTRTFSGDVKAGVQPDTLPTYDVLSFITKGILDVTVADLGTVAADLSSEVSRAESVESDLDGRISSIISNTDLTSIDSFSEVVADLSTEVSRAESTEASIALDFTNIYAKHVAVNETPNGTIVSFTMATPVRDGSELIYMNGLVLDAGDYTPDMVGGKVAGFTFLVAPSADDKVRAYGVC